MAKGGMSKTGPEQVACPDCQSAGGLCASHQATKDLYPHRKAMAEGGAVDALKPLRGSPKSHNSMPEMDEESRRAMYAEGGAVNEMRPLETHPQDGNEKQHPEQEASPMDMVSRGMDSEDASDMERDMPQESVNISLADEIMKDRKRKLMARGGSVESYESDDPRDTVGTLHGKIDKSDMSNLSNDSDELDAPKEDGRYQRGLNLEPVHTMEDSEHDVSDASLVSEILKDRKNRRRS